MTNPLSVEILIGNHITPLKNVIQGLIILILIELWLSPLYNKNIFTVGGDDMDGNITVLNRMFTQSTFKELLSVDSHPEAYYSIITRIVNDPYSKNNNEIISEIYSYLQKNYRNEYFYKNTLLNKLLLGVHKPSTTTALTELPISKSKADFVLINGKAIVYEIKTALDTFERLESQIKDYYKAFDHVAVLTDVTNHDLIKQKLDNSPVGIYLLTKRNQISCKKKPEKFTERLNAIEMFKVMNKNEFETIILDKYGYLPKVPPVRYYTECRKMFCDIPLLESYSLFLKELKKRNKIIIEEYDKVPYELKSLVYFSRYKNVDYKSLHKFLSKKFER